MISRARSIEDKIFRPVFISKISWRDPEKKIVWILYVIKMNEKYPYKKNRWGRG